jgi:hypothetical protein
LPRHWGSRGTRYRDEKPDTCCAKPPGRVHRQAVAATYSGRKDAEDFPSYAELNTLSQHFVISPRMLQIGFGWRGEDELILLGLDEMRQYMEQAGAARLSVTRLIAVRILFPKQPLSSSCHVFQ